MNTEHKPEMIWLDMETTGLNSHDDIPLELGMTLTDRNGNFVASFESLILNPYWGVKLDRADQAVKEMHASSGLWTALHNTWMRATFPGKPEAIEEAMWERDMFSMGRVQDRAIAFLISHGIKPGEMPMCGSSVHFDREFIKQYFNKLHGWFSYRNIDVSSIKEVCKLLNPAVYEGYKAATASVQKMHRVIPDIDASITEYCFYKRNFLHEG